uniref:Integrase n=1 Tax=Peronospora matthiolae TaxID=2874970 RepID=A0AAV1U9V4_9STRA
MARWLFFFAEYNFSVEYKPGRLNVVADTLSRRPDFEPTAQPNSRIDPTVATLAVSVPSSNLLDDVRLLYYTAVNGDTPRAVAHDDLRL